MNVERVMPVTAGIQSSGFWIPARAGMTALCVGYWQDVALVHEEAA
jgi:hypothetical protein